MSSLPSWVCQSLDEAIASLAEDEFSRLRRLPRDKTPEECLKCVTQALESLKGLQTSKMPKHNYNAWVALFYVTWYQPRQINIALNILRSRHFHFFSKNPFGIVDFGCGAWAVQFAVATAIAEKQFVGSKIAVQGIDPSDPMRMLGEKLWSKFRKIVDRDKQKDSRLSKLADVCDDLTSSCDLFHSKESLYEWCCPVTDSDCWTLIAIHALHETETSEERTEERTQNDLADLADISRKFAPRLEIGVISKSRFLEKRLRNSGYQVLSEPKHPSSHIFDKTTAWRKQLLKELKKQTGPFNEILKYLDKDVTASFRELIVFQKDGNRS